MGGWKKKAASSNQQREYSHCTRCHVAKHGNDRKFHYIKTVRGALPPHLSRATRASKYPTWANPSERGERERERERENLSGRGR